MINFGKRDSLHFKNTQIQLIAVWYVNDFKDWQHVWLVHLEVKENNIYGDFSSGKRYMYQWILCETY